MGEIRANLKEYAARYQTEDDGLLGVLVDERFKKQQRLLQEYKERVKAYRQTYEEQKEERARIRGYASDDESEYETITTTVETVLEENEDELDEDQLRENWHA